MNPIELLRTKEFRHYRWFITSSGKLVVGGKNAKQNDALVSLIKKSNNNYIVMHTVEPGSPFSIIMSNPEKISKKDQEECAILTACFSQAWKLKKHKSSVHVFSLQEMSKDADLAEGSWRVTGRIRTIKVPLVLVLTMQKETLRAVPSSVAKKSSEVLAHITPGTKDKQMLLPQLRKLLGNSFNEEQILSALPAGGITIRKP